MTFIYLDESGQLSKNEHSKYFVVAAFSVEDPRSTAKAFRSWCRSHFPRKMRDRNEIKWSATGISDELRLKTIRFIAGMDITIRFTFLSYTKIPKSYWKKDSLLEGHLYVDIICDMLTSRLQLTNNEFRVFCDRRKLGGMLESSFNGILEDNLIPHLPRNTILRVNMVDSTYTANIQIADWIAGALARYLEKGRYGSEYYEILKEKVVWSNAVFT